MKITPKIMKSLFMTLTLFFVGSAFAQNYSKVKIFTGSEGLRFLAEQGVGVDHGTFKKETFFITDLSAAEIDVLKTHEFRYEILIEDVTKYYVERNLSQNGTLRNEACSNGGGTSFTPAVPDNFDVPSTYGGYFRYNEMLAELDAMAAQYPNLISVKAPISTFLTAENRPIYHVVISDNPSTTEAEPNVLYSAIHHAREPMSMSQTIFYMWYLLENYGTNPKITFLVDNTQLFFVPCINPDGYIYNETTDANGGGMHRKNRNPAIGTFNKGVDLNRNYSYGWNTTGVSGNVNNDTYPGTSAFSEPETQAMKWLNETYGFISAHNAHTYGNTLLYPIGTTEEEFADHHDYFTDLAGHMCSSNGYFPQKSSGLYPASGDSDDYMYKEDIGVGIKDTVFAMTPEIGTDFWPASGDIIPTCQDMVFPNMVLSHIAHKYLVVREDDPSSIASMTGNFHHTVQRLGLVDGVVTVTLVPLLNIQSLGAGVNYDLEVRETSESDIAFSLIPTIQFGDEVKYIIETDYGVWIDRDTITKTYGALTEQIVDNAANTSNWSGSWNTTTSQFYSPSTSFTDSPNQNYDNDAVEEYYFVDAIDLTNATAAMISFYAKWEIEADYDYCQFQVSTDGGNSWIGQCGLFTVSGTNANGSVQPDGQPVWEGVQSSWVREEINLSDYLGETIYVRFQLGADGGVTEDGFYFDDFTVSFNETEVSSIDEVNGVSGISLFPNPTNGAFEVSGLEIGSTISIVDMDGKEVYSSAIKTEEMNIDIRKQAAGTYFVKSTKDGKEVELQFVVTK